MITITPPMMTQPEPSNPRSTPFEGSMITITPPMMTQPGPSNPDLPHLREA